MRTPGRALFVGMALLGLWAGQQGPAFREDASAFRAALSRRQALAGAEEDFHLLGAAVSPLVYRPDDEPVLPAPDLPEAIAEVAHRPPRLPEHALPAAPIASSAILPLGWTAESAALIAPAAGAPAGIAPPPDRSAATHPPPVPTHPTPTHPAPSHSAAAAYAALEAGALAEAAALFRAALAEAPSSQLAADLAYANLRLARRREAAAAFATALSLGPPTPEAGRLWRQERNRLTDRFALQASVFLRQSEQRSETPPFSIAAPGQSQSALVLHYRPAPMAARPVALIGRLMAAHHGAGNTPFPDTAQATAGLGWTFAPAAQATLVAERWIRLGEESRGAWALRAYGGHGKGYGPASHSPYWPHWSAFGEAAVVGLHRQDLFAGGEARAGYGVAVAPETRATLTAALWGLVQHDDRTRHRVEAGPSLGLEAALGQTALHLRLDYRIALTAEPASGNSLAFTLAAGF